MRPTLRIAANPTSSPEAWCKVSPYRTRLKVITPMARNEASSRRASKN